MCKGSLAQYKVTYNGQITLLWCGKKFIMQHLCACFGECDFVRVLIVLGKNLVFSPAFVCMFLCE
jgi:hypothetical protein